MPDFFPSRHADRLTWWDNVKSKIAAAATALGFTTEDTGNFTRWATDETADINAIAQKKRDYEEAVRGYADRNKKRMESCRPLIARGKTAAGYTGAIGEDLGWIGSSNGHDDDPAG